MSGVLHRITFAITGSKSSATKDRQPAQAANLDRSGEFDVLVYGIVSVLILVVIIVHHISNMLI